MPVENIEHVRCDGFRVSAQTYIHLVSMNARLFITLIENFFSVHHFELIFHLFFIRAVVQICGIDIVLISAQFRSRYFTA